MNTAKTSHAPSAARWQSTSSFLAGCAALALLAGCSSGSVSHRVSAPPPPPPTLTSGGTPVIIANQDGLSQTGNPTATIIVTQAPPTAVVEAVATQPSARHSWVPGFWTWRNNRYEWMAGHWEIPPFGGATWVAPRWEREGSSYRFYEGTWR